jgi:hypothetical protein
MGSLSGRIIEGKATITIITYICLNKIILNSLEKKRIGLPMRSFSNTTTSIKLILS